MQGALIGSCRLHSRSTQLLPSHIHIDTPSLLGQLSHCREVGHNELGRRACVDRAAEEPVHQPIMERKVGCQILAPQSAGPQNLCHVLVRRLATVPHRQEKGDVGVIGTRQRVFHEHIGIGVMQTYALIVANLPLDGV